MSEHFQETESDAKNSISIKFQGGNDSYCQLVTTKNNLKLQPWVVQICPFGGKTQAYPIGAITVAVVSAAYRRKQIERIFMRKTNTCELGLIDLVETFLPVLVVQYQKKVYADGDVDCTPSAKNFFKDWTRYLDQLLSSESNISSFKPTTQLTMKTQDPKFQ